MKEASEQNSNKTEEGDILESIVHLYRWLEVIVASLIMGLIVSFPIYYSNPGKTRLQIGIAIMILSLIIGFIIAFRQSKKPESLD